MTREIYALSADRSATLAKAFLERFLPDRAPFADEYPVPECSDSPTHVFRELEALMAYLDGNPNEPYGIYWNALGSDKTTRQAMLFYTTDGHLIFGLAATEDVCKKLFDELIHFADTGVGMFGCEQRPPETAREFAKLARSTPRD